MFKQLYTPGINLSWSWHIIFFIPCWIWTLACLQFLHLSSWETLVFVFFLYFLLMSLILSACHWKCSFLLYLMEMFSIIYGRRCLSFFFFSLLRFFYCKFNFFNRYRAFQTIFSWETLVVCASQGNCAFHIKLFNLLV